VKLLIRTSIRTFLGSLLFVVCASALSFAGDSFHGEFNGVVKAIESRYGVRHTHIPFLGMVVSVAARPAGVSNFRLALFEDFHSTSGSSGSMASSRTEDLEQVVEHSLGSDWTLFVRTHTRNNSEDTLIYVNMGDGKLQMLIVSIEPDEATGGGNESE
jgi:hypothetical protein